MGPSSLFKRWPLLARTEAPLLVAAACILAHRLLAALPAVDDLALFESEELGVPPPALIWGFTAFVLAGPSLGAIMLADRLLATRRGTAMLAAGAVISWCGFAWAFAESIAAAFPFARKLAAGPVPLVAGAALLVHAWPLLAGLFDRSFAAPVRPSGGAGGRRWRAAACMCLGAALVMLMLPLIRMVVGPTATDRSLSVQPLAFAPERPVPLGPGLTPPAQPAVAGGEASTVRRANGSFVFAVRIDDQSVPMVFDTGASRVTLRAEDAARLGIPVNDLAYSLRVRTANGVAEMAPLTIGRMSIGPISVANVPAVVARQGTMLQESLLGRSFLDRLKSYDVQSNRVTLHGR